MKEKIYEVDLYEPIRNFFIEQGYVVHGEVNHCDLTAVKEEELIIVEMKRNLTVDLLVQAANRQRMTDQVYIAIPKPKYNLFSKKWKEICHLIRRLELGLILVSFHDEGASMDIKIEPIPFDRHKSMQRSKKKRSKVMDEAKERHGDYNVGGSTKTRIMTVYKQNCIQIAYFLDEFGPLSPKALRGMGAVEKTLPILRQNYYGWFIKISRGIYGLNEIGRNELELYPELVNHYCELAKKSTTNSSD
ncbi:DUF2161 domain-containing phosphodiesterase [Bacillus sp. DJP31]|uniref:DUF2161 domain-containing phosphodiesterase n=1 Tax=Bacillus sp. DJP31 TaxID=3409789 RepID=UPI003BB4DC30